MYILVHTSINKAMSPHRLHLIRRGLLHAMDKGATVGSSHSVKHALTPLSVAPYRRINYALRRTHTTALHSGRTCNCMHVALVEFSQHPAARSPTYWLILRSSARLYAAPS